MTVESALFVWTWTRFLAGVAVMAIGVVAPLVAVVYKNRPMVGGIGGTRTPQRHAPLPPLAAAAAPTLSPLALSISSRQQNSADLS